jgi:mRNA-degrading endonuclease RelE of RelBE toxin-antitoxin system
MKFFTKKRYDDFNNRALSDDELDQIEQDWEKQLSLYKEHLEHMKPFLLQGVKSYLNDCCLHDETLKGLKFSCPNTITLDVGNYRLIYEIVKDVEITNLDDISDWMYDEIDYGEGGNFVHRILLTSCEFEIHFCNFRLEKLNKDE